MTLGEVLADMIAYGDIHEASWPKKWRPVDHEKDMEAFTRGEIAATLLKLTFNGPGGTCSSEEQDAYIGKILAQTVVLPT